MAFILLILLSQNKSKFVSQADSLFYYGRKQEDPLKAMEYYKKIISEHNKTPFSDSALMRIALFNYVLGDYKGAIDYFKKLINSKYEAISESAKYWLNMCYISIGDSSKVVKEEKKEKKYVYAIQIGAFKEEKFAIEYMKKFKDEGFDVYILKMDELFKVFVGKFTDKESAQKELGRLKEKNYTGFIQYICLP